MTATLDTMATNDTVAKNKEPADEPAELVAACELVRQARQQGLSLTGPDGLLKQPTKTVLETALDGELTERSATSESLRGIRRRLVHAAMAACPQPSGAVPTCLAIPVDLVCGDGSWASCKRSGCQASARDGSIRTLAVSDRSRGWRPDAWLGADPDLNARQSACCHAGVVARRCLVVWER
jgi:hypothetical protein